jgi:hypothetical protein
MDPQPYVNGYVYSNGQLAVGAPCVAPLLEITNGLCEPVTVSWINRVVFNDEDAAALFAEAQNSVVVGPGELTLLTNFYPSLAFERSVLLLQTFSSGLDVYVFNFSADQGYYLKPVPQHWVLGGAAPPLQPQLVGDVFAQRTTLLQRDAYSPTFCGNLQPKWRYCIIFPVTVKARIPQPPGGNPVPQC